jgi:hypothetical protein
MLFSIHKNIKIYKFSILALLLITPFASFARQRECVVFFVVSLSVDRIETSPVELVGLPFHPT